MSWVFLAGGLAYKLKKPTQNAYNWRSVESRREDCEREVRLNRRLAENVYHGVVPLTIDSQRDLRLEGTGEPVDWLVKMRRLREDCMLDWQIEHGRIDRADVRRAARLLCRFYQQSPPFSISGPAYVTRLREDLRQSCHELLQPQYEQSHELVRGVHERLQRYVARKSSLLEERVQDRRVIDAHGDLRPEHICLESPPVIIDCLQFDQRLRILDTASELSFLELECQRLGAGFLHEAIWPVYTATCRDRPAPHLRGFYKAYHACLRAMISVWHLKDDVPERTKWTSKAHNYLRIADSVIA